MSDPLRKRKRNATGVIVSRKRQQRESSGDESEGSESESGSEPAELDAHEIFRRHFETQFEALPDIPKPDVVASESGDDSEIEEGEEDEWEGISEGEDGGVLIVQHINDKSTTGMTKEELKAFMSNKPPSSTPKPSSQPSKALPDEDDASESANLKKDLALQRLLTESHLLESSSNPILAGNNRHKATELRLQALGSKKSLLKQEKMPMAHRKGIIAKATQKEETRRREARENGIILEKAQNIKKTGVDKKRDRGIGGPGVGRFSGGTLTLSKKDIFDIEGPKRGGSGRGGGGGRGGGRGRGARGGGSRGRGKR